MKTTAKPKINPLSRVPRQQRLVMAVRGGAGVGKSRDQGTWKLFCHRI